MYTILHTCALLCLFLPAKWMHTFQMLHSRIDVIIFFLQMDVLQTYVFKFYACKILHTSMRGRSQ